MTFFSRAAAVVVTVWPGLAWLACWFPPATRSTSASQWRSLEAGHGEGGGQPLAGIHAQVGLAILPIGKTEFSARRDPPRAVTPSLWRRHRYHSPCDGRVPARIATARRCRYSSSECTSL